MADKEIIINGIDVSECKHNDCRYCLIDYEEWNNELIRYNECEENPNCYFKQLKRKEKELQAQRNFTTQEQRKIYCVAYDKTCETGNECKQKKCVFKDRLKYKQALDGIKEICEIEEENNRYSCPNSFRKIQDIINKAKEK